MLKSVKILQYPSAIKHVYIGCVCIYVFIHRYMCLTFMYRYINKYIRKHVLVWVWNLYVIFKSLFCYLRRSHSKNLKACFSFWKLVKLLPVYSVLKSHISILCVIIVQSSVCIWRVNGHLFCFIWCFGFFFLECGIH